MTAFSACSGRDNKPRSAIGSPSITMRSARAPGLNHTDFCWLVDQQLAGILRAPTQHLSWRESFDGAVVRELATVATDLVIERIVLHDIPKYAAVVIADEDPHAGFLCERQPAPHVVVSWLREGVGPTELEQKLRVDEARHPERARLDHRVDAFFVDVIAVIDDVHAQFDAFKDHRPVGYMRPHPDAQ